MIHEPDLIYALDVNYSIGVKCLGCKWFMASSPVLIETMLNDFYNEHADKL